MKNHKMSLREWIERHHPSAFLLAAQFILLILYAVFDGLHSQRAVLSAFGGLILMLIVWVVDRSPAVDWVAWVLAIPAFVLSILSAFFDAPFFLAWSAVLEALLYFYAAGSLIAYMMRDTWVTTDELFAAGATFTLLAWGYAYAYLVLQTWAPGSFSISGRPEGPLTFVELLFLSFTNLSATGLGDMLPATTAARVLVMLEQFSGVGYITVVVSRLIGMTLSSRERKRHS